MASNVWNVNSGSTTYTGSTGLQRVQFRTTDAGSYGNFLDSIQLTLRPFIQLSTASSSGLESVASASVGTLRVSGTAPVAITVTVTVTGGTATLGTDYTTPGGGSTVSVTIPAGTYYDSAIPLGVTITNDSAIESTETISFSISTGTGYTLGHSTTCGTAPQTTSTYTITDDDSRVTLRKQWVNAKIGDDANVTISRGVSVIDTLASDAGTSGELDADATPTLATIGETLTLAETLVAGNGGSYSGAVACTGAADTVLSNGLTIATGETNIVCTYTNTRLNPQQLRLDKVWGANSITGHTATATTTGGVNNATFTSTAPTNTTGTAVTVYSGDVLALPAETYGGGGTSGHYNATLVCTGGSPLASGAAAAGNVIASDNLPGTTSFLTGTMRSGTSCAGAATVEDDNNSGTDETDPNGASITGTTITGIAPTLAAGGSFAFTFDVKIQ